MPPQAPSRRLVGDLTPAQRAALRARGLERRKVTPKALLARVAAVLEAYRRVVSARRADLDADAESRMALVGTLEDLASAAYAWALYERDLMGDRWTEPEDVQPEEDVRRS